MVKHFVWSTILSLFFLNLVNAQVQPANFPLANSQWNAHWIAAQGEDGTGYGVYYFRKMIELNARPASFIVHVSADNRYKLFVNGTLVSLGPARGDLYNWNYESVDLSAQLHTGKNIISAVVWNEAANRPEAQISMRTGFIIQGNTANEEIINTGNSWKCIRDKGYQPLTGFFAASTGELVDMHKSIQGWMNMQFDDNDWPAAAQMDHGHPKGTSDGYNWMLVPSPLPQMEMTYQRIPLLRKAEGMVAPNAFPGIKTDLTIPAHTTTTLLLDQSYLTSAYVTLRFSGGNNAGISASYAESMYDNIALYGGRKGNRNDVDGKDFSGRKDSIISSGATDQTYTTLYWRTFRYIRLRVTTADEPLVINDIYGTFTGYPFKQVSVFNDGNEVSKQILDIGWRTARLDAVETYMDCPYYEQLQYIGDTRIQALVTYYNSSDDRLARNALNLMDQSRQPEGVTLSRYPSKGTQLISTFSLWYIGMLHDYWMYRGDSDFIRDKLTGMRGVLDFFARYQQKDGSLKNTPYWTFVDWAGGEGWFVGSPPKGADGASAIIDLQLLWAYQWAIDLEKSLGMNDHVQLYTQKAAQLKKTIQLKYWDPVKKLYADTDSKKLFSQHANSLALLTGMVSNADMHAFGKRLMDDSTLTQCTIYFRYYLHQALIKAGWGNDYMKWLDVWRQSIAIGLTTWPEESNLQMTRSDCHAWGSSPNIEFYRTVLGIDSDAPGFAKVKIEPHLGDLKKANGSIPHPNGTISVDYLFENQKMKASITLPAKTNGIFIWKGKQYQLKPGNNSFFI